MKILSDEFINALMERYEAGRRFIYGTLGAAAALYMIPKIYEMIHDAHQRKTTDEISKNLYNLVLTGQQFARNMTRQAVPNQDLYNHLYTE